MKYFSKITLGLILCAGFVSSCKDDDEVGIDGITIDKEEITIGAEGGTEKIAEPSPFAGETAIQGCDTRATH